MCVQLSHVNFSYRKIWIFEARGLRVGKNQGLLALVLLDSRFVLCDEHKHNEPLSE